MGLKLVAVGVSFQPESWVCEILLRYRLLIEVLSRISIPFCNGYPRSTLGGHFGMDGSQALPEIWPSSSQHSEKNRYRCINTEEPYLPSIFTMSSSGPMKDFGLIPIPQRLRCNPTRPFPEFGIGLNLFFAFACTFGNDHILIWYLFMTDL